MPEFELGDNHFAQFFSWAPDDLPANRERYGVPLPNVAKAGLIVRHLRKGTTAGDSEWCESAVHFDIPEFVKGGASPVWTVESYDPLTLSPSLLCRACGDHGYIRGGRWVRA